MLAARVILLRKSSSNQTFLAHGTSILFRFSSNSDCICTKFNLHVFYTKRYTGSVSISTEKSAKTRFDLFRTSGTSQQRLHVIMTCQQLRLRSVQNPTYSISYRQYLEGRDMDLVQSKSRNTIVLSNILYYYPRPGFPAEGIIAIVR